MACHHPTQSPSCVLTVSVALRLQLCFLTAQHSGCPRDCVLPAQRKTNLFSLRNSCTRNRGHLCLHLWLGFQAQPFCQRKRKPHSRLLTPCSQVRPDGSRRHSAHAEPKTHSDPVLGEHVSPWGCRGSTRSQPGPSRPQPRGSRTCRCPLLTHGNQEPPRQARTEGGSSLHNLGGCLGHTCKHITTHNTHIKHL